MLSNILLVEDIEASREPVRRFLSNYGYQVIAVPDRSSAINKINSNPKFDAVIVDLKLPTLFGYGDEEIEHGLIVVQSARQKMPNAWIAVITGYADVQNARRAWELGADEFFEKPIVYEDLLRRLKLSLQIRQTPEDSGEFYEWPVPRPLELISGTGIIGNTRVMQKLRKDIEDIAGSPAKIIFLQGETGAGKELVAAVIHKLSPRKGKPYKTVNCAAITETMAEVDLFGVLPRVGPDISAREGFFKQADEGTLLLDEFEALPLEIQPKLLRALQYGEIQLVGGQIDHVDVRTILATNQDLKKLAANGSFRLDLFYRPDSKLYIPSLRERKEDIPLLVNHFIHQYVEEHGDNPDNPETFPLKTISKTVWELLCDYDWPGNIHELRRIVRSVLTHLQGSVLSPGDILRALSALDEGSSQRHESLPLTLTPNNPLEAWYGWIKKLAGSRPQVDYDHFKKYSVMRAIDEITKYTPWENLTYVDIGKRIGLDGRRVPEVIRAIAREIDKDDIVVTLNKGEILTLEEKEAKKFVELALEYYREQLS